MFYRFATPGLLVLALLLFSEPFLVTAQGQSSSKCSSDPITLFLADPPYSNYFLSTCQSSAQVVVTSPQPSSNLSIIGPRLLVAWPAGNSGAVAFFSPQNGKNGTLAIELLEGNTTSAVDPGNGPKSGQSSTALKQVYTEAQGSGNATVGVEGTIYLNDSAVLTLPILGSVRTLRDFIEGPSLLQDNIQKGIKFLPAPGQNGTGVIMSRLWLDNVTTSNYSFFRTEDDQNVFERDRQVVFSKAGKYRFSATFDYPQLTSISPSKVLNSDSQSLLNGDDTGEWVRSLSFFSTTEKVLAGGWRFLTYFGRDTLISLMLLDPVLSAGEGSAIEAGLGAVLSRVNSSEGFVCHEETIGDYGTYLNLKGNKTSTDPQYDYKMVDSDYMLQPYLATYLLDNSVGKDRAKDFMNTKIDMSDPFNMGKTYYEQALSNARRVMSTASNFTKDGGQTKDNLIHLKDGEIVGNWRDSTYGIGGARIPYDVNTAMVPAGLRAISRLAKAGYYAEESSWKDDADKFAQIWEDETLQFFEVRVSNDEANKRLNAYVDNNSVTPGLASGTDSLAGSDVMFYALGLDGNNDLKKVEVVNTDDSNNIQRPYPAGLSTPIGLLVANPGYGDGDVYKTNFSTNAYHGTVVWSWQMAMMARGLEIQLVRCTESEAPDFCKDTSVHDNVVKAYGMLWDTIDANKGQLASEVWSFTYNDGKYKTVALGDLPPPPGTSPTEADVRQLWSLTFLAVKRNDTLGGNQTSSSSGQQGSGGNSSSSNSSNSKNSSPTLSVSPYGNFIVLLVVYVLLF